MMSPTVKSYLKLYTTMDLKKLAGFLEVEPEKLRCWLLVNKQRNRQIRWNEGGLLEGDVVSAGDLDYAMEGVSADSSKSNTAGINAKQDLIHVSEAKVGRKLVDWYLRNLARTY
jgi:translation initiation factor 3 subunit L